MRIRYLHQVLKQWEPYWNEETNIVPDMELLDVLHELVSYRNAILSLDKKEANDITDAQLEIARNTPVETLIEFVNGKAKAFCHDDSRPSLTHWKQGNRAVCWPCNKNFDPIAILMERDGMSFKRAVKTLGGR